MSKRIILKGEEIVSEEYMIEYINQILTDNDFATKEDITEALKDIEGISLEIVTTLPTTNIVSGTIYLIKDETVSTEGNNIYNEYIYINDKWENLGTTNTTIDMSNYSTTEEMNAAIEEAISNIETGGNVDLTDYATKEYVDETVAANAGGDKLNDYDIYTIELPHNLKGTYPNITDEESLTKFNQILTNVYRRKIITNSDYYKSFIIVYSQSDTFIFLCSNLGTYCNLYGTYIDEPIDNNGYTCAYKMYITGSLDETAQTYKATSVKFDRDSKRVLLTNNTLTFTPTSNYHPATKKYVDDTIAASIAGISTTSMDVTTSLPTENISTSTIYLVKDETASTDTENIYNEYIYINGAWENIGSTKTTVDLSQYSTTEELSQMLSTALRNYLTVADMNAALSNYYTKTATDEAIENAINNIEHPTTDLSNYYNKQEIDTMIGDINSILDAINGEEV